jgi:hypothetical protein
MLMLSLCIYYYRERNKLSPVWLLRYLVLLTLPGLLYTVFSTAYYGTPIPHSILAKDAGLYSFDAANTTHLINARLREFVIPLIQPFAAVNGSRREAILTLMSLVIMGVGGCWMISRRRILWIVPALLFVLLIFYARSATLLFGWYYAHFDVLALWCFVTGIYAVLLWIFSRIWETMPRWIVVVLSIIVLLYIQHDVIFENASPETVTRRQPPLDAREYDYYQLAQQLAPQLPTGTVIATPEIGVLGLYLPEATILDAAGLVSPQTLAYFPVAEEERLEPGIGAIPRGLIQDYQPDLVITLDFLAVKSLLPDAWFQEHYTLVIHQTHLTLEHGELLVYARNDFAPGYLLSD